MIRQVRGTVTAVAANFLIIEVGHVGAGIGLRVFTTEPTSARFRAGDILSLYTYLPGAGERAEPVRLRRTRRACHL